MIIYRNGEQIEVASVTLYDHGEVIVIGLAK